MIPIPAHLRDGDPRLARLTSLVREHDLSSEEALSCLFWFLAAHFDRGAKAVDRLRRSASDGELTVQFDALADAAGFESDKLFDFFVGAINLFAPRVKAAKQEKVLH